jgi:hypothetical protein
MKIEKIFLDLEAQIKTVKKVNREFIIVCAYFIEGHLYIEYEFD